MANDENTKIIDSSKLNSNAHHVKTFTKHAPDVAEVANNELKTNVKCAFGASDVGTIRAGVIHRGPGTVCKPLIDEEGNFTTCEEIGIHTH